MPIQKVDYKIAHQLYEQGQSPSEIAKVFNVKCFTIQQGLRRHGYVVQPKYGLIKIPSAIDWAYLAGLFDAEGSVNISHTFIKRKQSHCFALTLSITNSNEPIMNWLVEIIGGHYYQIQKSVRPIFSWNISSVQAKQVLEHMSKYLRIKKQAADIGIEFQNRKKQCRKLSSQEIEGRFLLREKLRSTRIPVEKLDIKTLQNREIQNLPTQLSQDILAYTAGLFDGDGSINISYYVTKRNSRSFTLSLYIATISPNLIKWLIKTFGIGSIASIQGANSQVYHWQLSAVQAKDFLILILPYLKIKNEEAQIGIEFQSRKHQCQHLSDEELTVRFELKNRLQNLRNWQIQ